MTMSMNEQRITILAQDPSVTFNGALLLSQVSVPYEVLAPGPVGYRVKVVDFDASRNLLYEAHPCTYDATGALEDLAKPKTKRRLTSKQRTREEQRVLADPRFHAQHVYGVVMRTLARFEFALGRRVPWSFQGHQIHVVPHAFCDANAFYSKPDRALLFGYFVGKSGKVVHTCLSHDIVAHETCHALLDGLRERYTDPSGPDQAAFHEGFSDVVALLSVFSLREIVEAALTKGSTVSRSDTGIRLISETQLTADAIAQSILLGLGKQFGRELDGARSNALRRSVKIEPSKRSLKGAGYLEEHDRGEILAAAMMRSLIELWTVRIADLGKFRGRMYNLDAVIDAGTKVADHLLTMAIRALDYSPSVDLTFGDYLAALLTVDREVAPDDTRFQYRDVIRSTFEAYGIAPDPDCTDEDGCWKSFVDNERIVYSRTNFESMLRDREEVFRFVWENRGTLDIDDRGYTQVLSVRPSIRRGPDGFNLKETICEYIQIVQVFGAELQAVLGFERPEGMPATQRVTAYAGGVLVFDQYGRIKYHIERRLDNAKAQQARLEYLWNSGFLEQPVDERNQFAVAHRERAGWE